MSHLGSPHSTIEILRKYDIHMQKKFGQNFLVDNHVLEKIIRIAGVTKDDFVLEIGPGIGTLTQYLCESAGKVLAVEIDRALLPVLEETLSAYDNVEIICEDILELDLHTLIQEKSQDKPIKVVANLPYYITTPIIMNLLESHLPIDSMTVMIQKEVAERMQAGPGTKAYGALSLAVQYYTKPAIAAQVPSTCFLPKPTIGSVVIHLTLYKEPAVKAKDEELMFKLIRAAFNQRRKTLYNALSNAQTLDFSREAIQEAIEKAGFSPNVRGEALTLEQFAVLSDLMKKH